jgi:AcrR family transcriptional regulator
MSYSVVCHLASRVVYAMAVQEVATLPASQPAMPRRERKKQQTRDALLRAALELFKAKGYEQTKVREITDAVDVSERTFFRYFASKEDLAVSFVRDAADAMVEALAARPPEEEPLVALRQAFRESLREFAGDEDVSGRKASYLSVLGLIESTPQLLAAHLRYLHDHDDAVVGLLAGREGVDPATDPRPRLLSVLFTGLASLATRDWKASESGDIEAMLAAFDRYADQLGPDLFGHWH